VSALRHGVIQVACPECGTSGSGPSFLSDWNGETYLLRCGHRAHLWTEKGGAKTWLAVPATPVAAAPQVEPVAENEQEGAALTRSEAPTGAQRPQDPALRDPRRRPEDPNECQEC
jgi:hypothetical protein